MEEEPVLELSIFPQLRRRGKIINAKVLSTPPDSDKRYIVVDQKGKEIKDLTLRERQNIELDLWGTVSPEVARGLERQAFIAKKQAERKSRKSKGR